MNFEAAGVIETVGAAVTTVSVSLTATVCKLPAVSPAAPTGEVTNKVPAVNELLVIEKVIVLPETAGVVAVQVVDVPLLKILLVSTVAGAWL